MQRHNRVSLKDGISYLIANNTPNFKLDADKFQGPARKEEACAWVRRPLKFAGQLESYTFQSA
jgi:hypothetical protein